MFGIDKPFEFADFLEGSIVLVIDVILRLQDVV
jgi:hypothetical protein